MVIAVAIIAAQPAWQPSCSAPVAVFLVANAGRRWFSWVAQSGATRSESLRAFTAEEMTGILQQLT
jgi:hypothetical protein